MYGRKIDRKLFNAASKFVKLFEEKGDYIAHITSFPEKDRRLIFYLIQYDFTKCGINQQTREDVRKVLPSHGFKPGDFIIAKDNEERLHIIELLDMAVIDRDEGAEILNEFTTFCMNEEMCFESCKPEDDMIINRQLTFNQFLLVLDGIEI